MSNHEYVFIESTETTLLYLYTNYIHCLTTLSDHLPLKGENLNALVYFVKHCMFKNIDLTLTYLDSG